MKGANRVYSDSEMAGLRLACHAFKWDAKKVAARYPNDSTRDFCAAVDAVCDDVLDAIARQQVFTLSLYVQEPLFDYELSDDAYGKIE